MLYILHGDDTVRLRNRLSELITEQGKATFLNGDKASSTELLGALRSGDLFLETKYVVIEKVLKIGKKDMETIFPELAMASNSQTLHVVLCHDSELSKVFLGKFKGSKIEAFVMPKLFFTFLDNLTPQTLHKELGILLQMKNVEPEQVFYAMIKRIRNLLALKLGSDSEELVKMSPWQMDKLRAQGSRWKTYELENMLRELFSLEVKMKSGGLMLPLNKHLDILLTAELH